jgi:hypothetical protein
MGAERRLGVGERVLWACAFLTVVLGGAAARHRWGQGRPTEVVVTNAVAGTPLEGVVVRVGPTELALGRLAPGERRSAQLPPWDGEVPVAVRHTVGGAPREARVSGAVRCPATGRLLLTVSEPGAVQAVAGVSY